MNFGVNPTTRKGEADIGLLVACKVQLSSEVIKWKTENLRLVKELDSALHRTDNLEGTVTKLVDRTKELEEQLARAEEENMHLKHRNAAMNEEKNVIVQRLSMGFDKYHSFPYSDNKSRLSREGLRTHQSADPPVEDYMEVSQSLLNRMKLEMQQFREMGCQYRVKEDKECSSVECSALRVDSNLEECCTEDMEKDVTDLISKTQSIKQYLFNQRRKLQSLFNIMNSVEKKSINPGDKNHKEISSPSHSANLPSRSNVTTGNVAGPAEPTHSCSSPRPTLQKDAGNNSTSNASELQKGFEASHSHTKEKSKGSHRICPICEESFRDESQQVFEEHVMNHLERESISYLDQYVVI